MFWIPVRARGGENQVAFNSFLLRRIFLEKSWLSLVPWVKAPP